MLILLARGAVAIIVLAAAGVDVDRHLGANLCPTRLVSQDEVKTAPYPASLRLLEAENLEVLASDLVPGLRVTGIGLPEDVTADFYISIDNPTVDSPVADIVALDTQLNTSPLDRVQATIVTITIL